ncbi:MAG: hypothetical protein AAB267_00985, partial [Candidatus Desantisbacteria bacterium]
YPKDAIGAVTITETYEADIKTSVKLTYKIQGVPKGLEKELNANNKTIITVTKIWEAGAEAWPVNVNPTSIVYSYKLIEGKDKDRKLVTYTDTFIESILDSRQKSYYAEKTIQSGEVKFVQVVENIIKSGDEEIVESFSYNYWQKDAETIYGSRLVKVQENYEYGTDSSVSTRYTYYEKRDGRLMQVAENRVSAQGRDFIESVQYSYYAKKDFVYTKDGKDDTRPRVVTVIETYEGSFSAGIESAFLSSTQWEYTVVDNGRVKRATAYFDSALLDNPVSVQYNYKSKEERQTRETLITVIDSYENNILVSTNKIWKNAENAKLITHREDYEGDMAEAVSEEISWKSFDKELGRVVTFSEFYEGGTKDKGGIKTLIQKAYKDSEIRGTLATMIETYEPNLGTDQKTLQVIYYRNVYTELGGERIAKVNETWTEFGKELYHMSEQYIYRMEDDVVVDPVTNKTEKRSVTIIETYEGDFNSPQGMFLSQIEKDYAVFYEGNVRKAAAYYDPSLTNTPSSIQFRYKRQDGSEEVGFRVSSVVETYEAGINTTTQFTWKNVDNAKIVTHIESWELGVIVNEQLSWKIKENINGQDTVVTYTESHPFGSSKIDPTIEKTYQVYD